MAQWPHDLHLRPVPDAAEAHVTSAHFKQAQADLPQYLAETPRIRNMQIEGDHWDRLGEFQVS